MLQAADIGDTDRVLVAGWATGYTAALVARLAAHVTATESDPARAAKAKDVVADLGLTNVTFQPAAAFEGDPANAPYDVVVLDGATEVTPDRLYQQLKEGGRLVGVFALTKPQRAMIVTRSHGDFGNRPLFDASVPVLAGFERLPAFVF
jgi:protein-L-isoaspartate(D-aspartate) O-methyltransferase